MLNNQGETKNGLRNGRENKNKTEKKKETTKNVPVYVGGNVPCLFRAAIGIQARVDARRLHSLQLECPE